VPQPDRGEQNATVTEPIPSGDLARGTKQNDALSSPAAASSKFGLIEPCPVSRPRPSRPQPALVTTLAVAFSGGGFRATLAGLDVLRLLADAGLLGSVRYSSSVSGGSIANGLLARHYPELEAASFTGEAFDRVVLEPLVARITSDSLLWNVILNLWKTLGGKTRTNLLADSLAEWFFDDLALASSIRRSASSSTPPTCRPACGSRSNARSWATT
jgi:Patatin-like phospholipase